jgi:hypothetical protein
VFDLKTVEFDGFIVFASSCRVAFLILSKTIDVLLHRAGLRCCETIAEAGGGSLLSPPATAGHFRGHWPPEGGSRQEVAIISHEA